MRVKSYTMKKKQEVVSTDVAEKVKLIENLLLSYGSGLEPEEHEVERARELGVDIEGLRGVKEDDEASSY